MDIKWRASHVFIRYRFKIRVCITVDKLYEFIVYTTSMIRKARKKTLFLMGMLITGLVSIVAGSVRSNYSKDNSLLFTEAHADLAAFGWNPGSCGDGSNCGGCCADGSTSKY